MDRINLLAAVIEQTDAMDSVILNSKKWHAVYTRSRAEKKVHGELTLLGIESFLPVHRQLRQWKDRKKWVEMPLISGYCFVRISPAEYDRVLQTGNVVGYVRFEGRAAQIRDRQIEELKAVLKQNEFEVEITQATFEPGKKVEIIRGPLIGMQGELTEIRGKHKFLLRIEQIEQNFAIEVPAEYLSAIPENLTSVF